MTAEWRLREWAETQTAAELKRLAVGMPHKSEARKKEVIDWMIKYGVLQQLPAK